LWIVGNVVVLWLAHGSLPFDRPAVARMPFGLQLAAPTIGMIEIFVLMVLVFLLTRKRVIPDMAARAPDRRVARRETVLVLALRSNVMSHASDNRAADGTRAVMRRGQRILAKPPISRPQPRNDSTVGRTTERRGPKRGSKRSS
jgi:hypothetical protein